MVFDIGPIYLSHSHALESFDELAQFWRLSAFLIFQELIQIEREYTPFVAGTEMMKCDEG